MTISNPATRAVSGPKAVGLQGGNPILFSLKEILVFFYGHNRVIKGFNCNKKGKYIFGWLPKSLEPFALPSFCDQGI